MSLSSVILSEIMVYTEQPALSLLLTGDWLHMLQQGSGYNSRSWGKWPGLSQTDLFSSLGPQSVKERLWSELPGTFLCMLPSTYPCQEQACKPTSVLQVWTTGLYWMPDPGIGRACVCNFLCTLPLPTFPKTFGNLYVLFRPVLQGSGAHTTHGLPGQRL